ncbi:hypothetical protein HDV06_005744 [Boothiomyces sp. JEL0866]|nr:hypothetical protein HDV06_005744 [Boothiomyces sp. JEL0866]
MELLKLFIAKSIYITQIRITRLQIGFIIYHFVTMGGLYAGMGYIGVSWPSVLKRWYTYGFEIFTATCMIYETFHAYYITMTVKNMARTKIQLMIGDLDYKIDSKHFREINVLVLCSFTSDWTGLVTWLIAWYIGGQVGAGISIIGGVLGMSHLFFITIMFRMIKHIRDKTNNMQTKDIGSVSTELHSVRKQETKI